jgi:hypothetical protein
MPALTFIWPPLQRKTLLIYRYPKNHHENKNFMEKAESILNI